MKPSVTYPFQFFSCIVLLAAFLWLIIGTSFLGVEQQKQVINKTTSKNAAGESGKTFVPFENTTEEKTENSPNVFSGEYLKVDTEHFLHTDIPLKHTKYHFADSFIAFYGESVSHPPEILSC
ncbi:MAG: hypothetical protein ABI675_12585 [Chitinophagaceae bacterium]